MCRKRALAPQLRASEGLIQPSVFDRYPPRPCENTAYFCGWPSSASFFAIFRLLNDLRARKSEQNRSA